MPVSAEIHTARLLLRQWTPADRAAFAQLNADPQVMAFFPAVLDRSASDAMAERCATLIAERGWGFWAVECKANQQFIGFVGLHIPGAELPFSPCVEIGWRLARAYWGKGLATEAAHAVLHYAFEQLALQEIVSFTALGNLRSQAVMQRLGMQRSPAHFEHPALALGHHLRTHCLYRISRVAWERRP